MLPGREIGSALLHVDTKPDALFLAVPDRAVSQVAQALAAAETTPAAVVHLSGALGLAPLQPLIARGRQVGSFHPLQSFAGEQPAAAFKDIVVAIDGSSEALRRELEEIAVALGARAWYVPDEARDLYHAAAVMAANYLVALAAEAVEVLEAAHWSREEALRGLLPLMTGVLGNLRQTGLPRALTGPIRRGDVETVQRNLRALDALAEPGPARAYRILGLAALDLAREDGLDDQMALAIEEALTRQGQRPGGEP